MTSTLYDTAAELSATAADIAADITDARACPDLIGHARALLDTLAAGLGDATDHPVPYTLTPMALAALDGDEATLAETVPLSGFDGEPIAAAFNPGYLLDGLAAVTATGSDTARIALTTPVRPAVITPASQDGYDGCAYILMPVRAAG